MAKDRVERDEEDLVRLYLSDIGQYTLLTKDDEVRLAKQIEAGKAAVAELDGAGKEISAAKKREGDTAPLTKTKGREGGTAPLTSSKGREGGTAPLTKSKGREGGTAPLSSSKGRGGPPARRAVWHPGRRGACAMRLHQLDLNPVAFDKLDDRQAGETPITWKLVSREKAAEVSPLKELERTTMSPEVRGLMARRADLEESSHGSHRIHRHPRRVPAHARRRAADPGSSATEGALLAPQGIRLLHPHRGRR